MASSKKTYKNKIDYNIYDFSPKVSQKHYSLIIYILIYSKTTKIEKSCTIFSVHLLTC